MKDIKQGSVLVTAPLVRVTEKAIAIANEQTEETIWLPKSQIVVEDEAVIENEEQAAAISIWVPEWLAREKGLA